MHFRNSLGGCVGVEGTGALTSGFMGGRGDSDDGANMSICRTRCGAADNLRDGYPALCGGEAKPALQFSIASKGQELSRVTDGHVSNSHIPA
jgi:hypothetical protein